MKNIIAAWAAATKTCLATGSGLNAPGYALDPMPLLGNCAACSLSLGGSFASAGNMKILALPLSRSVSIFDLCIVFF